MAIFLAKSQRFSFHYHHNMDSRTGHSNFVASLCASVNPALLSQANPVPEGEEEPELITLTKKLLWGTGKLNRVGVHLMITRSDPPKLEAAVHGLLLDEIVSEFVGSLRMKISLALKEKNSEETSFSVSNEQGINRGMWRFQMLLTSEHIEKLKLKSEYTGILSIQLIPVITRDDGDAAVMIALPKTTAVYKRLLDEKICWDFTIIAKNGKEKRCHKAILALHIPTFASLFKEGNDQANSDKATDSSTSLNLSEEGVNALLKFIYYSNVDDMRTKQNVAVELIEFANNNGMTELTNFLKNLFMKRGDTWDVDLALSLFSGANGDVELETKAFQIIKAKPYEQLSNSPVYKELFVTKPKKAMELFRYFLESNN